jgi:restriction endonuclease S subunit
MGETLIKGDLTGQGKPIFSADTSDAPWAFSEPTRLSFGRNTLVIGARGTIGSVKFPNMDSFTCTQTTIAISGDTQKVLTEFLYHWLKTFDFKKITEGVGIPMITVANVNRIEIPLPPLEIQKEIVAEIEGYQKIINGARAVLDNYRPHIPINPDWPMVELGVICDLYQPKTITQQDLLEDGAYLVFGANGVIGRFDQYNHEEDEVLITCRGATCGTVNRSEPKSWITGNAMVAHPKDDRISKDFLFSLLKGSDLGPTISGSAQPQITRQGLAPFSIPLPPLAEQQAIVAEIEAEQALVNANRELITRFETKIQTTLSRIWGDESSVS